MNYVCPFDTEQLNPHSSEVVVVGSGVAGLRSALSLSENFTVSVITKGEIRSSNTWRAQGGIAAVLRDSDSAQEHVRDTMEAGAGLCDRPAVEKLIRKGPKQIKKLIEWGADFDREGDDLAFTREGGHRRERVIHGRGDATGSLVEDTLVDQVRMNPRISVYEDTLAVDLLREGDEIRGLLILNKGELEVLWARAIVLATGGLGQVFRETTNHPVVTGDGMAMCLRASVELQDMEFIQFHPTTLYIAGGPRFLISEAVRGEGAVLRDKHGERFMDEIHELAELAPRDIVSRAILQRMIETDSTCVYLDATELGEEVIRERFPTIVDVCSEFDIGLNEDPIPVRPCAHYCMGGIRADLSGTTEISNLFCLGETACTGVHGANRLASNSLLEGLVMGDQVVKQVGEDLPPLQRKHFHSNGFDQGQNIDTEDLRRSLKSLMWRKAGIRRRGEQLRQAGEQIDEWLNWLESYPARTRETIELKNMMVLGRAITRSALERKESRGAHMRDDYPETDPDMEKHSLIRTDPWQIRYIKRKD